LKIRLENLELIENEDVIKKKSIKIFIPQDQYPEFNFVGRILGPKGLYLQKLEKVFFFFKA
jgi:hypothetical protein